MKHALIMTILALTLPVAAQTGKSSKKFPVIVKQFTFSIVTSDINVLVTEGDTFPATFFTAPSDGLYRISATGTMAQDCTRSQPVTTDWTVLVREPVGAIGNDRYRRLGDTDFVSSECGGTFGYTSLLRTTTTGAPNPIVVWAKAGSEFMYHAIFGTAGYGGEPITSTIYVVVERLM